MENDTLTEPKLRPREYWIDATEYYKQPYFRLEKCARIVNSVSGGLRCDLLDVGCGPGTLDTLLDDCITYYGIDIAIHEPAPNLFEKDLTKHAIGIEGRQFDIIVAAGFFEYVADLQDQKLSEIEQALKPGGTFITTYTNFQHVNRVILPTYNNVRSISQFKQSLESRFHIDGFFPSSHNWVVREPEGINRKLQTHFNLNIPIISRRLAVNYFFICSCRS